MQIIINVNQIRTLIINFEVLSNNLCPNFLGQNEPIWVNLSSVPGTGVLLNVKLIKPWTTRNTWNGHWVVTNHIGDLKTIKTVNNELVSNRYRTTFDISQFVLKYILPFFHWSLNLYNFFLCRHCYLAILQKLCYWLADRSRTLKVSHSIPTLFYNFFWKIVCIP